MDKSTIIKSFKFRIAKPSKVVQERLETTLYLCRDLYNSALQERKQAFQLNRISLNYYDQANQLKEIKQTNPEYKNVHSQISQDVLKRVDKAFQNFFRRVKSQKGKAGFPRFKGQNRYNSFTFTQSGFSLSGNKLKLSKIGTVKLKLSRDVIGKGKTLTIKNELGKWFAIFTVETSCESLPKTNKSVGLDMGILHFVTLSNGTQIENFRHYESSQKKLRIAQRSVSRKKKDSNRRRKAVMRLKKIHQKIRNQRNDFHHKVSTSLVQNYDVICIEKLNLLGLSKGFLAKQMNDVAIGNFLGRLEYKAENAERRLIKVPSAYTSQDCSACGNRVKKDLSVRVHHCLQCNLILDRDINAAINILSAGLADKSVKYQVTDSLLLESPFITASV